VTIARTARLLMSVTAWHVVDGFSQPHDGVALEKLQGERTFSLRAIIPQVTEGKVELTTNPYTPTGKVQEVHDERRDSGRLSFPCFRTNARYDPAMSGGPVFAEDGHLCGHHLFKSTA
jgi:hypothetical protein